MYHTLVSNAEGTESNITVFVPGLDQPLVAHSSHPNFKAIVAAVLDGERDGIEDLFDTAQTVARKFERLSERVTVANGQVYFDGDLIDNSLTTQIVRVLNEDGDDGWSLPKWHGLVNFMENVQTNPDEHSREQLYEWLARRDFTITDHGYIVGYKGVRRDGEGYRSISSGSEPVLVESTDGTSEVRRGRIYQQVGDTVSMARSLVEADPSVGCHVGLHVGTFDYARSFGGGLTLEVHVNPRDVVSVPTDCDAAKVRACSYTIVDEIEKPYEQAVVTGWADYDDDEYDDDVDSDSDEGYCEWCDGPCEL
jgi:hypothetical protein